MATPQKQIPIILDLAGLSLPSENIEELLRVKPELWKAGVPDIESFFEQFGERLLEHLRKQLNELVSAWGRSTKKMVSSERFW